MDDAERARIREQARLGTGEVIKTGIKIYLKIIGSLFLVLILGFVGCSIALTR